MTDALPPATLLKSPGASDAGANGHVLLIMNEESLGTLLFYCLTAAGFRVRLADPATKGTQEAHRELPEVALLDGRLPDRRSTEIWNGLRTASRGARPPAVIMFITGEADIDPRLGIDLGPCDFMVYPLSVRDLVLRIDALVRLQRQAPESAGRPGAQGPRRRAHYEVGPLTVDVGRHLVTLEGVDLAVSPLELRLLAYLIEHRDRVCTRADLLSDVWGYRPGVASRATDIHVNRLRAKLGAAAPLIETLRGTGYRLSAKVPVVMRE